jgi:hypothetical protein
VFEHTKKLIESQTINRAKESNKIDKYRSADLAHLIDDDTDKMLEPIRSKSTFVGAAQEIKQTSNSSSIPKVNEPY